MARGKTFSRGNNNNFSNKSFGKEKKNQIDLKSVKINKIRIQIRLKEINVIFVENWTFS